MSEVLDIHKGWYFTDGYLQSSKAFWGVYSIHMENCFLDEWVHERDINTSAATWSMWCTCIPTQCPSEFISAPWGPHLHGSDCRRGCWTDIKEGTKKDPEARAGTDILFYSFHFHLILTRQEGFRIFLNAEWGSIIIEG